MSSIYGNLRISSGSTSTTGGGTCLFYLYLKLLEDCRWKMKQVSSIITLMTTWILQHFHTSLVGQVY
ncbi:unnamed protein product [Lathyrus oleraceus]